MEVAHTPAQQEANRTAFMAAIEFAKEEAFEDFTKEQRVMIERALNAPPGDALHEKMRKLNKSSKQGNYTPDIDRLRLPDAVALKLAAKHKKRWDELCRQRIKELGLPSVVK